MHGLHLIADLRECEGVPLDDVEALRALCRAVVAEAGLRPAGEIFHPFVAADGRRQGVTGVVLLAESHLAIHTWPELRGVTADVYVCNLGEDNSARAERAMAHLVEAFRPGVRRVEVVERGGPTAR